MKRCRARAAAACALAGLEDSGEGGEDKDGLAGTTNGLDRFSSEALGTVQSLASFYQRADRSHPCPITSHVPSDTRRSGLSYAKLDLSPVGASDPTLLPLQGSRPPPPASASRTALPPTKDTTPAGTLGRVPSLTFGFLVHKTWVRVPTALSVVRMKWGHRDELCDRRRSASFLLPKPGSGTEAECVSSPSHLLETKMGRDTLLAFILPL